MTTMASNDPQPGNLPRSSTINSAASTGGSCDLDAHLHCSCPTCHHYHHAHPVKMHINRRRSIHCDAQCERCNRRLFSFGGMRRRLTLASQETLPPITDDRSASFCVSSTQVQPSRLQEEASPSRTDQDTHAHSSSGPSERRSASPSQEQDTISADPRLEHTDGASIPQTASEVSPTTGPGEVAQTEVPVILAEQTRNTGAKKTKGKLRRLFAKIKGPFGRFTSHFRRWPPTATPQGSTPSGNVAHNKASPSTDKQHDTTPPPISDHLSLASEHREGEIHDAPLSDTRQDERSIFSSSHMPDSDNMAEQRMQSENPEGDESVDEAEDLREFEERRRQLTLAISRGQVIACHCDETCTCREDRPCPPASNRVSAPSTDMPPTTTRPSSELDVCREPMRDQNLDIGYMGEWIHDQNNQRNYDDLIMRPATRDNVEHHSSQSRTNAADPRRHSTELTDYSGTTTLISHDDLELSILPPAPTPPLRTEFSHPPRSLTMSSNLSSRSLPRLATQNLQPPLETVGERSSASEHSQEQQRAFTDSAVQTDSAIQRMPPQTETLDNVDMWNNPYNDHHVSFRLLNGHEPSTPPRNSNDTQDDSGISVGPSSATRLSPASSLPHANT